MSDFDDEIAQTIPANIYMFAGASDRYVQKMSRFRKMQQSQWTHGKYLVQPAKYRDIQRQNIPASWSCWQSWWGLYIGIATNFISRRRWWRYSLHLGWDPATDAGENRGNRTQSRATAVNFKTNRRQWRNRDCPPRLWRNETCAACRYQLWRRTQRTNWMSKRHKKRERILDQRLWIWTREHVDTHGRW